MSHDNQIAADQLPDLIASVYNGISGLSSGAPAEEEAEVGRTGCFDPQVAQKRSADLSGMRQNVQVNPTPPEYQPRSDTGSVSGEVGVKIPLSDGGARILRKLVEDGARTGPRTKKQGCSRLSFPPFLSRPNPDRPGI